MQHKKIADTDVSLSALSLGTVKIGRNQSVKYPSQFDLPNDQEVQNLFALAKEFGINTLDTAPAYGVSEERLGQLLKDRQSWNIISKAGEIYDAQQDKSRYIFTPSALNKSLETSLRNLRTDYLDCWLLHSDGNDISNLNDEILTTLLKAKERGLVRSIGASTKTVEGGEYALKHLDCIMMAASLNYQDEYQLFDIAERENKSLLLKKIYDSGWILNSDNKEQMLQDTMHGLFSHKAVCSAVVGTINPTHLKQNVQAFNNALCNDN